jgi:hypothetical protein
MRGDGLRERPLFSISLPRLWRDQGKVREARELLASVYGWSLRDLTRAI